MHLSESTQNEFLCVLIQVSDVVIPLQVHASRDPADDKFLGCALAANATYIVTGDKDLLVLDPWRGIRVVTPRMFLNLLRE